MAFYLDTSALVKRYADEAGTERVAEIGRTGEALYIARVTAVETVSALSWKSKSDRKLVPKAAMAIISFRSDYDSDAFDIVEIDRHLVSRAMALAEEHGLRGYDAVQLAAALTANAARTALGAGELTFVCADSELSDAAEAEGLAVERV